MRAWILVLLSLMGQAAAALPLPQPEARPEVDPSGTISVDFDLMPGGATSVEQINRTFPGVRFRQIVFEPANPAPLQSYDQVLYGQALSLHGVFGPYLLDPAGREMYVPTYQVTLDLGGLYGEDATQFGFQIGDYQGAFTLLLYHGPILVGTKVFPSLGVLNLIQNGTPFNRVRMRGPASGAWVITGLIIEDTCPDLPVSPRALPRGEVGVPYDLILSASGGIAPYRYAITAGNAPPFLHREEIEAGVLRGTPVQPGVYSFTITVHDLDTCPDTRDYTLIVD